VLKALDAAGFDVRCQRHAAEVVHRGGVDLVGVLFGEVLGLVEEAHDAALLRGNHGVTIDRRS